jgi:hypothetical protein
VSRRVSLLLLAAAVICALWPVHDMENSSAAAFGRLLIFSKWLL